MGVYEGFLLNCLVSGRDWSDLPSGGKVRNRIPLILEGIPLELIQEPALIGSRVPDFTGQSGVTTIARFENVDARSLPRVRQIHERLAELLLFATQSEVRAAGYRKDFGDPSEVHLSKIGSVLKTVEVIDRDDPEAIQTFLESCWSTYRRERRRRRLPVVFEYSLLSQKSGQPIELKLVTTFVMFECLKFSFAKQHGYPFIRGYFRETASTAPHPGRPVPFGRLIREMLAEVGLRPRIDALVRVRNELIHSGLSRRSFREHVRLHQRLQDIARRYILRLLGYRKQFVPLSSPNSTRTA